MIKVFKYLLLSLMLVLSTTIVLGADIVIQNTDTNVTDLLNDGNYTLTAIIDYVEFVGAPFNDIQVELVLKSANAISDLSIDSTNPSTFASFFLTDNADFDISGFQPNNDYIITINASGQSKSTTKDVTLSVDPLPPVHNVTVTSDYSATRRYNESMNITVNLTNNGDVTESLTPKLTIDFDELVLDKVYLDSVELTLGVDYTNTVVSNSRVITITNSFDITSSNSKVLAYEFTPSESKTYSYDFEYVVNSQTKYESDSFFVQEANPNKLTIYEIFDELNLDPLAFTLNDDYDINLSSKIYNNGANDQETVAVKFYLDNTSNLIYQTTLNLSSSAVDIAEYTKTFDLSGSYDFIVNVVGNDVNETSTKPITVLRDLDLDTVQDEDQSVIFTTSKFTTTNFNGSINITVDSVVLNKTEDYVGSKLITFKDDNEVLVEFNHDFNNSYLNLNGITVKRNTTIGGIIVNGLTGTTKTLYMKRIDSSKTNVCVKTADITEFSEISANCNGASEKLMTCSLSDSQYPCEMVLVDGEYYFKVQNLEHSAIIQTSKQISSGSSGGSSGSSGGSSGGSGYTKPKDENVEKSDEFSFTNIKENEAIKKTLDEDLVLTSIEITTKTNKSKVEFKVELLKNKPTDLDDEEVALENVVHYLKIDHEGLDNDDISESKLAFKLENKYDEYDVNLYRFNGKTWDKLITTIINSDDEFTYYEAITSNLSYFAIKYDEKEIEEPTVNVTIVPTNETLGNETVEAEVEEPKEGLSFEVKVQIVIVLAIILAAIGYNFLKPKPLRRKARHRHRRH